MKQKWSLKSDRVSKNAGYAPTEHLEKVRVRKQFGDRFVGVLNANLRSLI
jgi:hypothetical protein